MIKLQCTNKECESNTSDTDAIFSVDITVDENADVVGNAKETDGKYFMCCHCTSVAEWVEVEK